MRCLITGINGFVGAYLAGRLLKERREVCGLVQPGTSVECLAPIRPKIRLIETEITDHAAVFQAVRESKPERIFHLAGQSHVPTSWADPVGTFRVNVEGLARLLEASAKLKVKPRVLLVSSGDVYGLSRGKGGVISESLLTSPLNPYAASKVSAEMLARCYSVGKDLPVVIVRPFNHIGPGQSPAFVTGDFARQIAMIEAGLRKPVIKVGDLTALKDFTDVRDMVRAYTLAIEKCPTDKVFNICFGKSYSIREILETMLKISGVEVKVVREKQRLRVAGSNAVKADSKAFRRITGWKPEITIGQTLADILEFWREKVSSEK